MKRVETISNGPGIIPNYITIYDNVNEAEELQMKLEASNGDSPEDHYVVEFIERYNGYVIVFYTTGNEFVGYL